MPDGPQLGFLYSRAFACRDSTGTHGGGQPILVDNDFVEQRSADSARSCDQSARDVKAFLARREACSS
ncbi:hypothetical protein AK812_SmicGene44611 [Symbiodinium microadriaticum]|uniref:Uncharacterized protein n=1 Tax=Symbiodinium microadriaticum TaxID=2951 RepID=A0A1Q9BYB6_SYMMI|nr:hypothetical protein AK812_SmicGene44611 [Symbiodinium microadriaticum]